MSRSYGRMSGPGCSAKLSSSASGSQPAPGFLPTSDRLTWSSGLTRNRRRLAGAWSPSPKASCGGRRKVIVTSVAVTGRHLPARIRMGTSAHRQESAASLIATYVSVTDFGSTPATWR